MTAKINQAVVAPNIKDGLSVEFGEAGTGVVIKDQMVTVRRARLTLTAFSIAVLAANDYGGTKLLDLPDRNIMLLGMEVDTVVTKQGNTNGVVAATDITMAVGTATASNATLSGAMIDVIEGTSITPDTLAVDFEKHSNDQATATFPKKIADGANSALYMNIAAAITADSSVTVDGIIDIFYVDLGKLA
jgi:hypothetical protein